MTSCQADETASFGAVAKSPVVSLYPARWSWFRWRLSTDPEQPVTTRRAALATPPAVVLGLGRRRYGVDGNLWGQKMGEPVGYGVAHAATVEE